MVQPPWMLGEISFFQQAEILNDKWSSNYHRNTELQNYRIIECFGLEATLKIT